MRCKNVFVLVVFLITLMFPFASHALADTASQVVLPADQTVNKEYFAAGNTIILDGVVNGDAYLAGQSVLMEGTVNGDLIAAGGNITIKGTVAKNIRVAGGQVIISGQVGGNVTVAGGTVMLMDTGSIGGSLIAAGGKIDLLGAVTKEAYLGGGQIFISNSIGSDVIASGNVILSPGAKIVGQLQYFSRDNAQIDPGATVSGSIIHNFPPQKEYHQVDFVKPVLLLVILSKLAELLFAVIVGSVLFHVLPIYAKRMSDYVTLHMWKSFGIGFLVIIAAPFSLILLALTIVGLPIIAVGIFFLFLYSYVGGIFVAFSIGRYLLQRTYVNPHWFFSLLLGLVILGLLQLIPLIGWVVSLVISLTGLGVTLLVQKQYYVELRNKKIL